MAVYFVTGKLGSGKTLAMVGRIKDYLIQGRRVATNLDLNLDDLLAPWRNVSVTRIPDKPTADDLDLLGKGDGTADDDESYDEAKFGALVLDECALSLNTRTWSADKGRQAFINWFVHARKKGWDVFFIIQDLDAIDKQVRDMFCEHLVVCERMDRMSVNLFKALPFVLFFAFAIAMAVNVKAAVGFLVMLFCLIVPIGQRIPMPKIHRAKVYYGDSTSAPNVDTWVYTAKDLYSSYNTRQKYFDREHPFAKGMATMLSPWHLQGRYTNAQRPTADKVRPLMQYAFNGFFLAAAIGIGYWSFGGQSNAGSSFDRFMGKAEKPVVETIETDLPTELPTDLTTKTVDNFGVRIAGSMSFENGLIQYFFERDDQPVEQTEVATWTIRPFGPCAAQIEIAGQFHEVHCGYAVAGLDDSHGVLKGGPQALRDAVAVGAITDVSPDILP